MTVTVSAAHAGDAAGIRALDGLSATTRRLLDREFVAHDRCGLVARTGGRVVGYLGALVGGGEAQVLDLAVAAGHRRHGVATALVTELGRRARDLGADTVTLEVRESNTPARALYRRCGFTDVGRRPGYYPDGPGGRREAAVVMTARPPGKD